MYEFVKKMFFDERAPGIKSTRDKTPIRLFKSPAIKVSVVSTNFLPENPNEVFDRLNFSLQEKEDGYNSNIFKKEIIAVADELLE